MLLFAVIAHSIETMTRGQPAAPLLARAWKNRAAVTRANFLVSGTHNDRDHS
jgi:hypothetical protein